MDARDLRVFEVVARLGAMARAAAELHTVQSNVTARIRALEAEVKTPLFRRHARGVTLTAAGRRLLPYAERVRRLLDDARRTAQDDGTPRGPLTIGSLETTAALRLSPLLSSYVTAYPETDLVLRTGTTAELVEAVREHRLDGAFVCGPIAHPELEADVVFREELAVVTARSVRSLAALIRTDAVKVVVLRAGCSYRQRLEAVLASRGVTGARVLEFGTLEAIVSCVAAGIGVTLLPRAVVEPARRAGRVALHRLRPAEARAETLFIRRRDALQSSTLTAFLECVRSAGHRAVR